jgi:hypothetical protein
MHLGQKLLMPFRLMLACAIFIGAARVHPTTLACTFKLCGVECEMHAPQPKPELMPCCHKAKQPEQKKCKCPVKASKTVKAVMAKTFEPPKAEVIVMAEAPAVADCGPVVGDTERVTLHCHGPPGERPQTPDLGRAPPVL